MNIIGLILIAALSGFIVAVSLRLRSKDSPAPLLLERDALSDPETHHPSAQRSLAERAA